MRIFFLILIVFISVQHTSYAVEVDEKIYNELGVDEVVEAVPNDVKNLLQPLDLFSGQGLNKVMEQLKTHISNDSFTNNPGVSSYDPNASNHFVMLYNIFDYPGEEP